ncbi:PAS domain-containing protein [Candidatus Woesearchaeota archaeon]|nr:PAS domain-containing protein [Candidatus Woesearchaeota archaeon]
MKKEVEQKAFFSGDLDGRITSWSEGASSLFGFTQEEVLGKIPPHIPKDRLRDFRAIFRTIREGKSAEYITTRLHKDGTVLPVHIYVAPLYDGERLLIGYHGYYEPIEQQNGAQKRTFTNIRTLLLADLAQGQRTINQIATNTGVNWKTVENHLIYLAGKKYIKEIFSSKFVRIFELTPEGRMLAPKEETPEAPGMDIEVKKP